MSRSLLLSVCAVTSASCGTGAVTEPLEPYAVASPSRMTVRDRREYVAEVQAVQRAELRARFRGVIEGVPVDEGQPVKAGQLLFSISARELLQEHRKAKAATASAAAELRSAELERENVALLFEKKVVAAVELALAEARVQALSAKLDEARATEGQAAINLSYAEVRAPFDGVVNRLPRRAGTMVAEGDALTTLADTGEVFVYFRVSEPEYLAFKSAGDAGASTVTFKLADGSPHAAPGRLDAVETEFDRSTGTIAFRARFANPLGLLRHGSSGKVVIETDLKDALLIPQRATFEVQEHVYVFAVDAEGRARARRITPRLRLDDAFVLESGLGPDERFILEGVQRVKEGQRVDAREAASVSPR